MEDIFEEEGLPEGELEEDEEFYDDKVPYKRFDYSKALPIHEDQYGVLRADRSNEPIRKFKFSNMNGLVIEVTNLGATILAIKMPDKFGNITDVLLGYDTVDEYFAGSTKFGAMIGRTANIIEDATFKLDNKLYFLRNNAKAHHRDGGVISFDKTFWKHYIDTTTNTLILTYFSSHNEEGYPANLITKVTMKLSDENEFIIDISSTCDAKTPVDISPRLFFNLAGHESGERTIKNHKMLINADMYVRQNSLNIPTGELKHVNQTYFDLRTPKPFHYALDKIRGGGYNHTFCLNKANRDANGMLFATRLEESDYGRYVEIWTDSPGLYIYTANGFPAAPVEHLEYDELGAGETDSSVMSKQFQSKSKIYSKSLVSKDKLIGKQSFSYFRHGSVAISPQGYPNSVNIPGFPSCIYEPHRPFQRKIIYKFGVSNKILARPEKEKIEEEEVPVTNHNML